MMSSNSDQQPSTSGTNNNASTSEQASTSRQNEMVKNSRFNCSSCRQNTLIPNKPVFYLPCLHILCYECHDKLRQSYIGKSYIHCPKCHKQTNLESIFDDFTYEPDRKKCENTDCKNEEVFSKCTTCPKYLCEPCSKSHDINHRLKDSSTYIPVVSRCKTAHTPNRFASYICSCDQYLCISCSQTHQCKNKNIISISSIVRQTINHMSAIANNDRKLYGNYQKTYESIQNRKRQIIAEFHNARSSVAHNATKSASLLLLRFNDIREHLNSLQQSILTQLTVQERIIANELQTLRDVAMLEQQIPTTKDYNAIPFFAFVKAASANATQACKHQNFNIDHHIPPVNIRVDTRIPDLCTFLNGIGTVYINGSNPKSKTKFDNSVLPVFDVVPKINCTNTSSKPMGYAVKILDGKKHVVVDEEEIRRKVKMLQDPDELRDRCKQLESEVAYYKALAHHLEGELKDKPAHEQPSTSKAPQPNANPPSISVWPENNNHSNRHSFTQQQLLQQLQQAAAQKRAASQNVHRGHNSQNSNNSRRGHNIHLYPDPAAIYQQAMHGHPNMTPHGIPPTLQLPGSNMHASSSVPGSPQFNSQGRLANSAVQSPSTPNPMMPQNMIFPRPPNVSVQEWHQFQLMQQQLRRNPQQNQLVNELMRNSIAQLSPSTAQMSKVPRMTTPPGQTVHSRPISGPGSAEVSKSTSRESSDLPQNSNPVEILTLSDDEDGSKQNPGNGNLNTNGKAPAQESTGVSNSANLTNKSNENSSSKNSTNAQTPGTDAFNRAFRFMSADHPPEEANEVDKSTRSSSVPQQNNTVSDPKVNSSQNNVTTKSQEKPNETENGPLPPIKLKLRLGGNSSPVVVSHSNSTPNERANETSVESENTGDAWDDFCYICNEGCDDKSGDLGCCSSCPKVFHQFCHIPLCEKPMGDLPDDWKCGLCLNLAPIRQLIDGFPENAQLVCSRITLLCFKDHQKVEPFKRADFTEDPDAVNLIKIAFRLSKPTYGSISEYITDMNNLFKNSSRFNSPQTVLADYGRTLYKIYQDGVRDYLPAYSKELWLYVNLFNKSHEVPKKKRRIMD